MKTLFSVLAFLFAFVVSANAALVAPTLETADALTIGGAVVVGLAGIWGIKQAVSLMKRG